MTRGSDYDTAILGAGAAGLMCAAHVQGRTLLIDHAKAPGEKIRISGGGRCNFTNLHCAPDRFLSANPHFAKSALKRYTPRDFVAMVDRHRIPWHEKTLGQLFCDRSARDITAMLLDETRGADMWLSTTVADVTHADGQFTLALEREGRRQTVTVRSLVLATGGRSIPKMGATGLAHTLGQRFGLELTDIRPGLVPLTFGDAFASLAGVALPARVTANGTAFDEALLFTHRGLSGPAVLQASSYWTPGAPLRIALADRAALWKGLRTARATAGRRAVATVLADHLPTRLAAWICDAAGIAGNFGDLNDRRLAALCDRIADWTPMPTGTEGWRTAEVTLGGIDTAGLDSRTMAARHLPGLYAIGEAVDVTGWLGGYNFQWAWASGHAAGTAIAARR